MLQRGAALFIPLSLAAVAMVWAAAAYGGPLAAALAASGTMLAGWAIMAQAVLRPLRRLGRGMRAVAESRSSDAGMKPLGSIFLGDLPADAELLIQTLRATRRETRKAVQAEAAQVEAQKTWLESILQGLGEGIFVCNRQHRIMLYNAAAVRLLDSPERIGLDRSLGDVIALAPLRHSLTRLEQRHAEDPDAPLELSAPFVCTSADRTRMLHGRMALLTDADGGVTGYLVTIVDISSDLAHLARGDGVRRALTRDLRGMVGNLRAAAETMVDYPDMRLEDRLAFERVVLDESMRISAQLDELGREVRGHLLGRWPMADIYVTDLVKCLEASLEGTGVRVTLVGLPIWIHCDSLSLLQVLEGLVPKLAEETGARSFDVETLLGDTRVYLDILWEGEPIPSRRIEDWLELPSSDETPDQKLRHILERHGSEPWSDAAGRPGFARLRLPLPAAQRPQFEPGAPRLPPRPEFYDLALMRAHQGDPALATKSLRELEYVVFDCEMTGLQPMQGDEIIQIAAVRVVRGRILSGEGFERVIDPGRPIPPASIPFHGLTDADVAGKPSILEVLPEFRAYVGDAVLVGHNAAFDMKFLSVKERASGVAFENPVLDTMLISSMLDGAEEEHSLDALCERYGVMIAGRHTALGDTIGTADLLLKLIDRLEARGLATFGGVMEATNMAAQLRHRSAVVNHGAGTNTGADHGVA